MDYVGNGLLIGGCGHPPYGWPCDGVAGLCSGVGDGGQVFCGEQEPGGLGFIGAYGVGLVLAA